MTMSAYLALLRKDPDSDYGIELPDFPGCVSAAEDMEQARELAEEALRFHIEGLLADGGSLPRPSSFEKVMADPENREAAVLLVQVPKGNWRKSA
jgi:predicted RNase H-like HicB family nuclease